MGSCRSPVLRSYDSFLISIALQNGSVAHYCHSRAFEHQKWHLFHLHGKMTLLHIVCFISYPSSSMPTGTIKKKTDKGFGFITVDGSSDVFFHSSSCVEVPFDQLNEGQTVQFEMGQGPKGPKAENVRPA